MNNLKTDGRSIAKGRIAAVARLFAALNFGLANIGIGEIGNQHERRYPPHVERRIRHSKRGRKSLARAKQTNPGTTGARKYTDRSNGSLGQTTVMSADETTQQQQAREIAKLRIRAALLESLL